MAPTRGALILALALGVGACGRDSPKQGTPDPTPARGTAAVVSGAGRLSGGTLTLDVQLGAAVEQRPASHATTTLSGGAAVRP